MASLAERIGFPARATEATNSRAIDRARALSYVACAVLILLLVALHTAHFEGRNFRQDEVITAHASTFRGPAEVVQWMANEIHPPLWRITGVMWAKWFGQAENVVRFLSTLLTVVTLAAVFRLASDTLGRRVGLLAVFVLGTLNFYQFYSHEFRPYPALMMFTALSLLALQRWVRQPNFKHALIYVVACIGLIYTHYFGLFAFAAQILTFVVLVKWRRGLWIRALGLWAAIGIAFLPWTLVFIHTVFILRAGGVTYAEETDAEGLARIYDLIQIRPQGLGLFLLLAGLVTPVALLLARRVRTTQAVSRFRFGPAWRKWYVALPSLVIFGMVVLANTFTSIMTARNLSIMVPGLAILAAFALAFLPRRFLLVALALIVVPAVLEPVSLQSNAPYQETVAFIQSDFQPSDKIVLNNVTHWWTGGVYRDFLFDRLPIASEDQTFYSIDKSWARDQYGTADGINTAALQSDFRAFLGDAEQVWYVAWFPPGTPHEALDTAYESVFGQDYVATRQQDVTGPTYLGVYRFYEFRRIPPERNLFHFGDHLTLESWRLLGSVDVERCDSVNVESWWRTDATPNQNYSMTLVLADASGSGIARNDSAPGGVLTGLWQPEQFYLDERALQVPCDVAPGDYNLLIGLYLPDPVTPLGDLQYLTTLHVR